MEGKTLIRQETHKGSAGSLAVVSAAAVVVVIIVAAVVVIASAVVVLVVAGASRGPINRGSRFDEVFRFSAPGGLFERTLVDQRAARTPRTLSSASAKYELCYVCSSLPSTFFRTRFDEV